MTPTDEERDRLLTGDPVVLYDRMVAAEREVERLTAYIARRQYPGRSW